MNEAAQYHPDEYVFDTQPRNVLNVFHDYLFMEQWIKTEQKINKLFVTNTRGCLDAISEGSEVLNELFDTEHLAGKPVVVSGKLHMPIQKDQAFFEPRYAQMAKSGSFRFSQIRFIRIKDRLKRTDSYHAAIKLNSINPDNTIPLFLLLEDAMQVDCKDLPTTVLRTNELQHIFDDIVADSQVFRLDNDFANVTMQEQKAALEERTYDYYRRLQPLIDHKVPLLIDTDKYTDLQDGKTTPTYRVKKEKNAKDGNFIIAGHLKRVAFIGNALNASEVPHLVLENTKNNILYSVPLDADYHVHSF